MLKDLDVQPQTQRLVKAHAARLSARLSDSHSRMIPENIADGTAGLILVMIEAYRQLQEAEYLSVAGNSLERLFDYCKKKPTRDYSLFTGRAGVAYVLMQQYAITGEDRLIDQAVELMLPANREFLFSDYSTDYLFEGRAGTLLIFLHLYLQTGKPVLLEYIKAFTDKIISNSRLTREGISWTAAEEIDLRPSCSFAHGSAGIRYVFEQLNRVFPDPNLSFIIAECRRYENSCWVNEFRNWGNFRRDIRDKETMDRCRQAFRVHDKTIFYPTDDIGWANGSAGMLLSNANAPGEWNASLQMTEGSDLYQGLPGIGVYLLQQGGGPADPQLAEIAARMSAGLPGPEQNLPGDDSLFHGSPGTIYFLLKMMDKGRSENVLVPFSHARLPAPSGSFRLSLDGEALHAGWLQKYYPRTIQYIQALAPHLLKTGTGSFQNDPDSRIKAFRTMIDKENDPCLKDLYMLEAQKTDVVFGDARSPFRVFMEERSALEKALEDCNRPEQWLLGATVSVSGKVRILVSAWDWSFKDNFERVNDKQVENPGKPPGRYEYLVQVAGKKEPVEFALKTDTALLLHQFDRPKRVCDALRDIRAYVQSLPRQDLQQLLITLSSSMNTDDFIEQLDKTALFNIRQWICRGILLIN